MPKVVEVEFVLSSFEENKSKRGTEKEEWHLLCFILKFVP